LNNQSRHFYLTYEIVKGISQGSGLTKVKLQM
jgi:hypothetical protein